MSQNKRGEFAFENFRKDFITLRHKEGQMGWSSSWMSDGLYQSETEAMDDLKKGYSEKYLKLFKKEYIKGSAIGANPVYTLDMEGEIWDLDSVIQGRPETWWNPLETPKDRKIINLVIEYGASGSCSSKDIFNYYGPVVNLYNYFKAKDYPVRVVFEYGSPADEFQIIAADTNQILDEARFVFMVSPLFYRFYVLQNTLCKWSREGGQWHPGHVKNRNLAPVYNSETGEVRFRVIYGDKPIEWSYEPIIGAIDSQS